MQTPLNQVMNPTDEQRHEMLRTALESDGRPEDYEYILRYLSPPPDITTYGFPGDLKGVKIGIIGGGLAGMSAAFELRKLGAEITILDASEDRIGGRVYTYYFDPEGNDYGEFGAMRIPVSHETTWYYINLFGLNTLSMTSPHCNNFHYVHNTRMRITESAPKYLYPNYDLTPQERNIPWQELSSYALEHSYRSLTPQVRSELIQLLPNYSPDILPLMNMSLRKNFESLGLSQGAIQLISGADPVSGALLHISYDEIAQDNYTLDYQNTYRIDRGNANLPYAFYHSFFHACPPQYGDISSSLLGTVTYRSGHHVTGIYQSDYRNKVVLRYRRANEPKVYADIYDYVICAIPFSCLRTFEIKPYFSNQKMQSILELNYIDALKALYLFRRRFWEKDTEYGNIIGGISFTDLPIQSIIYPSDHHTDPVQGTYSPKESGVLTIYHLEQNYVRLGGLQSAMQYELIRQNIEEVHGLPRGYLNNILEQTAAVHWNSEPFSLGAMSLFLPGQKPQFAYENLKPEYHNRVYFAGEHVSNKHGWIQGALSSGKGAANQLAYQHHSEL